jgi:hypothetical protein
MKQEYTSAKTSIKQIPAGFRIIDKHFGWQPGTVNLDIGGGKYDLMTIELQKKGVKNLIYDPFNRPLEHNLKIIQELEDNSVDTVTMFNLLNVIKEFEIQLNALNMAYDALKHGGMLYVRSTYMNPAKVSGVTKSGTFQHYKTQKEYLEIVREIFHSAELKYGIIFAKR